ncbi:MAG: hypothetical protein ABIO02_00715 [Patescibacteria group bacterium]
MGSISERFPGTYSEDLSPRKEVTSSAYDSWNLLDDDELKKIHGILKGPDVESTIIVKAYDIMPQVLVTKGLTFEEAKARSDIIVETQLKSTQEENFPLLEANPFNRDRSISPMILYLTWVPEENSDLVTYRTYFLRNQRTLSKQAFWPYVNRVFTDANKTPAMENYPRLILHSLDRQIRNQDSMVWKEPIDEKHTRPISY